MLRRDTEDIRDCASEDRLTDEREDVELSDAVKVFCERNGLKEYFQVATSLAKKHFSSLTSLNADMAQDPDSDDKWITLGATLTGTVDSVLAAYNNYSSEWVRSVPSPQRFMIALSLNVI